MATTASHARIGVAGSPGQDFDAVSAALSTPHHNGSTEGVNTRTKMIKRQMDGRASLELLRHRILLDPPPKMRQSQRADSPDQPAEERRS